jgi:hypothetical protein
VDGKVGDFAPHVLVRNDADLQVPEGQLRGAVLRLEVLYTDGMAVRISVGARSYGIEDASMEDLLSLGALGRSYVSGIAAQLLSTGVIPLMAV